MAASKTSLLDEIFDNLLLTFSSIFFSYAGDGYFASGRKVTCC